MDTTRRRFLTGLCGVAACAGLAAAAQPMVCEHWERRENGVDIPLTELERADLYKRLRADKERAFWANAMNGVEDQLFAGPALPGGCSI